VRIGRIQAAVIGDSEAAESVLRMAEETGARLARHGIVVVCGGMGGVMEAACRGAVNAGGTTVGILPGERRDAANRWCTIVIPTGLSHARNALTVLASDFIVVIGGGAGTLSEISFAWIHGKPILALAGSGGWADRIAGTAIDSRRKEPVLACPDPEHLEREALAIVDRLVPRA
jgi:uncharacterized protein (TIGR00725 family)